jgi:hypothetical protein
MAPSCDKQFPNAYYMLATLFAENNIDEALRCCVLAAKAENYKLITYFSHFSPILNRSNKRNDDVIEIEDPACAINVI